MQLSGSLRKLVSTDQDPVDYRLPVGDALLPLNEHIGAPISLAFGGCITCIACGRNTSKSFNQGYCYPCFKRLARCDICIVRPESCHFHDGTCREPEWGETHCMQNHIVYLANSSGIKVGITRGTQIPTRWIDQGAAQALPVFRVGTRYQAGLLEVAFKQHVADKTDWRRMLKQAPPLMDLLAARDRLLDACGTDIDAVRERFGIDAVNFLDDAAPVHINFPIEVYPEKVVSQNFDKTPEISGRLNGIKGQYLILDSGVLNIRRFAGYEVSVTV